ncbi:MAG: hypothetical protein MUF83_15080 [Acidimicrobiales bacterium]|nr:hypothetical protein [Acidimicrobiales bacterium]
MSDADPTGPGAPRRRHRRVRVAVAGAAVVVGATVAGLVVLANRDPGEPVSVEQARARVGEAGFGTVPAEQQSSSRPEAGVYLYRGEGTEHLDAPPVNQGQGPEIPGTVTYLDAGCWQFRVDYNTNHWQSWTYCPDGADLSERAGMFFQRLDLVALQVETTSSYTCDPPVEAVVADAVEGDEWSQECRGTSTGSQGEVVTSGPYTFVGSEELDVGGAPVSSLHYRRVRTLSGGQTGTEAIEWWFDAGTGLPLRNERTIEVRSATLVGGVTYTETGFFQLASTTPTR